jgi:hypothetical protein
VISIVPSSFTSTVATATSEDTAVCPIKPRVATSFAVELSVSAVKMGSPLALALDNPDTPITRARTPVIRSLETLFNLDGIVCIVNVADM